VTDPPYYDNIYYSVLADFFYTWKRLLLVSIEPQLFNNESTDYRDELVASTRRNGSTPERSSGILYAPREGTPRSRARLETRRCYEFHIQPQFASGMGSALASIPCHSLLHHKRPAPEYRAQTKAACHDVGSSEHMSGIRRPQREVLHASPPPSHSYFNGSRTLVDSGFASSLLAAGWHAYDVGIALFAQGVAQLLQREPVRGLRVGCRSV